IVYLAAAGEITSNLWNFHIFHLPVAMFCGHGALLLATLASRSILTPAVVLRSICIVAVALAWSTFPLVRTMKKPISMKGKLLGE
ncbi:glycosyl transferase, partial [Rhizobium ruizarguesonis]